MFSCYYTNFEVANINSIPVNCISTVPVVYADVKKNQNFPVSFKPQLG